MRIAYFPKQVALNGTPVLSAFLSGCNRHGLVPVENAMDADVAVIWSVLWHGRMADNHAVWQHYQQRGRPVIVIDVGTLHRGATWKIAVKSITADGHYGHQQNLDPDRPQKLDIRLRSVKSRNPKIVIAAQHGHSLQTVALPSIEQWIVDQIQQLRSVTDRPIAVRPHPRYRINPSLLNLTKNEQIERPQHLANTYDSYDLEFDCHALVNHNSGPGIQAALAGTRPIVDSSSLAWPVSTKIENIERPYDIDRQQWLIQICHTEYTVEEIAQGSWYARLEPALK